MRFSSLISLQYGNFVDNLRLYVRGGSGGMGLPRLGGQGGKGGNVWVVAKKNTTLKKIKDKHPQKRFVGAAGANSRFVYKCSTSINPLVLDMICRVLKCIAYVITAVMFLSVCVRSKGRWEKTARSLHPLESQSPLMMAMYLVCEMLLHSRFCDTMSAHCIGVSKSKRELVVVAK